MLGLKLNHVSKRGPVTVIYIDCTLLTACTTMTTANTSEIPQSCTNTSEIPQSYTKSSIWLSLVDPYHVTVQLLSAHNVAHNISISSVNGHLSCHILPLAKRPPYYLTLPSWWWPMGIFSILLEYCAEKPSGDCLHQWIYHTQGK